MNKLLLLLCVAGLAGCAQINDRVYGSWLDRMGQQPAGLRPLAPDQATAMRSEAVQLRTDAESLRARLAVEPDRVRRVEYMRELQVVGDKLHALEKALRDGGVEAPPPAA